MSPLLANALAAWVGLSAPTAALAQPKYGPATTRLSQDHAYFRTAKTTDFWSLIPYYLPQMKEYSCGFASIAMVINAARSSQELNQETELVTEASLEDKIGKAPIFGMKGLEQLQKLTLSGLEKFGVKGALVDIIRLDPKDTNALEKLRSILRESEKDPRVFLIANFDQNFFTDDVAIGHISPIGAYNAGNHRVLILDPDRNWYEPYWVPDERLLKAVQTKDFFHNELRGLVRIRLPAK